ncbi:MAG: hypothetical protein QM500_15215 [Methylococcales bacterium]
MGLSDYIKTEELAELQASIKDEIKKPKKQSTNNKLPTKTDICNDFFFECKDDFEKMFKNDDSYGTNANGIKALKLHIAKLLQSVGQKSGKLPYAYINKVNYQVNGAGIGKAFDDGMSLVNDVDNPDVLEKLTNLKGTKEEREASIAKLTEAQKEKKERLELVPLDVQAITINALFKKYSIVR